MKNSKSNLHQSVNFIMLIVFLTTLFLLGICFWVVKDILNSLFADKNDIVEQINTTFPYISGFANLIITTAITVWVKARMELRLATPHIVICPEEIKNHNGCNISGEKKEKPIVCYPKVFLGQETKTYRIVSAKIVNVGKTYISECTIERQKIVLNLSPGESTSIFFILYVSDAGSISSIKNNMISYSISDENSNTYFGSYNMAVDIKHCKASFHIRKKIKKGVKNVLPNL